MLIFNLDINCQEIEELIKILAKEKTETSRIEFENQSIQEKIDKQNKKINKIKCDRKRINRNKLFQAKMFKSQRNIVPLPLESPLLLTKEYKRMNVVRFSKSKL